MQTNSIPISVVIFTKNEEKNITDCINSVSEFNEVIVVDSESSDSTVRLSENLGAKVVNFSWNKKYPKKRQWSIDNIEYQNEWILFLDADERVSVKLINEIKIFITFHQFKYCGASLPIDYFFAGVKLRFGQKPRKTVLFRTDSTKYPIIDDLRSEGMGELEGHYQPLINGKIRKFRNSITHNDNDPIVTWMFRHINYAKWEAFLINNIQIKKVVDDSKSKLSFIFHRYSYRPIIFFTYSYFIRLGFLDGRAGFNYAFAKAWYYWLSDVIARENVKNVI